MDFSGFNATLRQTIDGSGAGGGAASSSPASPLLILEQQQQQAKSERIEEVKKRVLGHLRTICKGAAQLPPNSPSRRLDPNYWLNEVVYRELPFSYSTSALLRTLWRESKELSFFDFTHQKVAEYQAYARQCDSPLTFDNWMTLALMRKTEHDTWKNWCIKESQTNTSFEEWKHEQQRTVQEFGIPLWALIELYEDDKASRQKTNKAALSFEEWLPIFKTDCAHSTTALEERFGLKISVQSFAAEQFCYSFTRSSLDLFSHILNERLRLSDSTEDLKHYAMRSHYAAQGANAGQFEEWLQQKEAALQEQHNASRSSLSFAAWKEIQRDNVFNASPRLMRCTPEQRIHFLTNVGDGILLRNGHPLNTNFENVDGKKKCIFVVGPDQQLYCASKVRRVFQHSSFFDSGAVCAAGALRTDEQGRLKTLSNSSGHYRSDKKSDFFMLDYFRQRGVDLSTVRFSFYGSNQTLTAGEYYSQLSQIYRS